MGICSWGHSKSSVKVSFHTFLFSYQIVNFDLCPPKSRQIPCQFEMGFLSLVFLPFHTSFHSTSRSFPHFFSRPSSWPKRAPKSQNTPAVYVGACSGGAPPPQTPPWGAVYSGACSGGAPPPQTPPSGALHVGLGLSRLGSESLKLLKSLPDIPSIPFSMITYSCDWSWYCPHAAAVLIYTVIGSSLIVMSSSSVLMYTVIGSILP